VVSRWREKWGQISSDQLKQQAAAKLEQAKKSASAFSDSATEEINKLQSVDQSQVIEDAKRRITKMQQNASKYTKDITSEYTEKAKKTAETITEEVKTQTQKAKSYTQDATQHYEEKVRKAKGTWGDWTKAYERKWTEGFRQRMEPLREKWGQISADRLKEQAAAQLEQAKRDASTSSDSVSKLQSVDRSRVIEDATEVQQKAVNYTKDITSEYTEKAKKAAEILTEEVKTQTPKARGTWWDWSKAYERKWQEGYRHRIDPLKEKWAGLDWRNTVAGYVSRSKETAYQRVFTLKNKAKEQYEMSKLRSQLYLHSSWNKLRFPYLNAAIPNTSDMIPYTSLGSFWGKVTDYMKKQVRYCSDTWQRWVSWPSKYKGRLVRYLMVAAFLYGLGSALPGAAVRYQLDRERYRPEEVVAVEMKDKEIQTETEAYDFIVKE